MNAAPKTEAKTRKPRTVRSRDAIAVEAIMRCNLRELTLTAEALAKRDDMVASHFASLLNKTLGGK